MEQTVDLSSLNEKARKAMAEVQLLPGETILRIWEGEGFFLGVSPMAKAISKLMRFMAFITCGHIRVYMLVTNMRIVIAESNYQNCGAVGYRAIKTVALGSLLEASIRRDTQCCCLHTRFLQFQTKTEDFTVVVKKLKDEDLKDYLDFLGRVMVNNAQGAQGQQ